MLKKSMNKMGTKMKHDQNRIYNIIITLSWEHENKMRETENKMKEE